ncbi:hypothetical protein OROMI_013294 [Orobanche minor]
MDADDELATKASKRSPLILRMVVLLFSMVCGLYVFSICIKQTNISFRQTDSMKIQPINRRNGPCRNTRIQEQDLPYVHFPKPQTFSSPNLIFLSGSYLMNGFLGRLLASSILVRSIIQIKCLRQECACNPVRFFAIVSMQRSGSGWFETLLNSHTNLSSNGEIFGPRDRRSNVSSIYETLDLVYNLDWLSSASKNECLAAVGFKWMLNQVKNIEESTSVNCRRTRVTSSRVKGKRK